MLPTLAHRFIILIGYKPGFALRLDLACKDTTYATLRTPPTNAHSKETRMNIYTIWQYAVPPPPWSTKQASSPRSNNLSQPSLERSGAHSLRILSYGSRQGPCSTLANTQRRNTVQSRILMTLLENLGKLQSRHAALKLEGLINKTIRWSINVIEHTHPKTNHAAITKKGQQIRIDERMRQIPSFSGLKHFNNFIDVSQ